MKLSNEVYDEIKAGFDEELKEVGDEWTGIKLQRVFLDVSFRAGNRIFVGLPMCRDKKYKKAVERWTAAFGLSNMVSRFMLPTELRGIFLRLAAIPTKFFEWRAARFFMERIKERLARLQNGEKCDENDMMQWIIDQNASKRDPRELEPQNIAGKMILFNIFGSYSPGLETRQEADKVRSNWDNSRRSGNNSTQSPVISTSSFTPTTNPD